MIYLILGHSGSGKSTLRDELTKKGLNKIITYTTRAPRPNEVNGLDYNFIDIKDFKEMEDENLFIGSTCYAGNYYSTLKKDLEVNDNDERDCVIIVDKEGVHAIKNEFKNSLCVYLKCSKDVLKKRMIKRAEDESVIEKRLSVLENLDSYADYIIDSDREMEKVLKDVFAIIKSSKSGKWFFFSWHFII